MTQIMRKGHIIFADEVTGVFFAQLSIASFDGARVTAKLNVSQPAQWPSGNVRLSC